MKIADLYIRVSTDEQKKGYSPRYQEEVLRTYCLINGLTVGTVINEDYSAKTFNRPAWGDYLKKLKVKKQRPDFVLFTKWDRFSRNAPDAYQMIGVLRKLLVEPQAIEQPLDLSIPENKMMLAIYLTSGEVENDRRALNVTGGMRRAKKEGRWMGTAPLGYVNVTSETGKKSIVPHPKKSIVMKWVFNSLAEGVYNTEQIWKRALEQGLNCSKNTFWNAIKHPVYCGKIWVPATKQEAGSFYMGQHQPLISEALFYKAQHVLENRGRPTSEYAAKMVEPDNFFLRGSLTCVKCGKKLTGSASKGRSKYYYYYHCYDGCTFRANSTAINDAFTALLDSYKIPSAISVLFKVVVAGLSGAQAAAFRNHDSAIDAEITSLEQKIKRGKMLMVEGHIEPQEFQKIKATAEGKMDELIVKKMAENKLFEDLSVILERAADCLNQISRVYLRVASELKLRIFRLIFKENLVYSENLLRTTKLSDVVVLMAQINRDLADFVQNKNGTSQDLSVLSHRVIPLGFEPRTTTLKV
ncbi:recombinase family protein [Pedobacter sp. GR22-6]|uniref:recombinase family protein n=1 Tax=Pedobacter sp. GR22-6 TaxID=3127957 RepID=UPI003FCD5D6A